MNNLDEVQIKEIYIYDISGRLIKNIKPKISQADLNVTIDLYDFTEGYYIINILDVNGERYQKELLIK